MKYMQSLCEARLDMTRQSLDQARQAMLTASVECEEWPAQEVQVRDSVLPSLRSWHAQLRALWPPVNWRGMLRAFTRIRLGLIFTGLYYRTLWLHPAVVSARVGNLLLRAQLVLTQLWLWRWQIISAILLMALITGTVFGCYFLSVNRETIINFVSEQLRRLNFR